MEMNFSRRLNAPANEIWALMGEGYGDVGQWARGLKGSHLRDPGAGMVQGAIRVCERDNGQAIHEQARIYDPHSMTLSYTVVDGMPSWVAEASNTWTIRPDGLGCVVTARAVLTLPWWLRPVTPLMRMWIRSLGRRFMDDMEQVAMGANRAKVA